MKTRIFWLSVVVAAIGAFYYTTIRPALNPTPRNLNKRLADEYRPPEVPPPPLPAPRIDVPALPLPAPSAVVVSVATRDDRKPLVMEVPIQNGATIDFSRGGPIVRSNPDDQAALERSLKEMAEATKDTKFAPPGGEKK